MCEIESFTRLKLDSMIWTEVRSSPKIKNGKNNAKQSDISMDLIFIANPKTTNIVQNYKEKLIYIRLCTNMKQSKNKDLVGK